MLRNSCTLLLLLVGLSIASVQSYSRSYRSFGTTKIFLDAFNPDYRSMDRSMNQIFAKIQSVSESVNWQKSLEKLIPSNNTYVSTTVQNIRSYEVFVAEGTYHQMVRKLNEESNLPMAKEKLFIMTYFSFRTLQPNPPISIIEYQKNRKMNDDLKEYQRKIANLLRENQFQNKVVVESFAHLLRLWVSNGCSDFEDLYKMGKQIDYSINVSPAFLSNDEVVYYMRSAFHFPKNELINCKKNNTTTAAIPA